MKSRRLLGPGISLISTLVTVYLLETVLSIAPTAVIDKLGTSLRKGPSVIAETYRLRQSGLVAYPYVQPDTFVDSVTPGLKLPDGSTVVPLSGMSATLTVLCNESGTTIGYRSDSLGFRNPSYVRSDGDSPTIAIVGDSFAHGFCRPEGESVAGQLRMRGIRVSNLGLTGAGPLAELGVIREFLPAQKPKRVYWLFYEGNDLIDLVSERNTVVAQYLNPDFSQRLLNNAPSISASQRGYADSLLTAYKPPGFAARLRGFLTARQLRTAIGLVRGVKQPSMRDESKEIELMGRVLVRARDDIRAWGGELYVVYLPERRRFNKRSAPVVGENHDPHAVESAVLGIASRLEIPVLNAASAFAQQRDPTALWNARRYHYNRAGYRIVADLIEQTSKN